MKYLKENCIKPFGIVFTLFAILLITSANVLAHNKVVIIPMAGDAKPLGNVITVAKKNGDFTNPHAAMNSITDAGEFNPYLIVIGPGVYTLGTPLVIKPYVSVAGSGRKSTTLEAGFSALTHQQSAVVDFNGAAGNALSNLTINQYGSGGKFSLGIYALNGNLSIYDVDVNVNATGETNYGIYILGGSGEVKDTTVTIRHGQNANIGTYLGEGIVGSQVKLTRLKSYAYNGILNVGIYARSAVSVMESVTGFANNATGSSWGIYNTNNAYTIASRSHFSGQTEGCFLSVNSTVRMEFSNIFKGCSGGTGTSSICVYTSNATFGELGVNCRPL